MGFLGPKWPKFRVFGHFLEFKSLDFCHFADYDRLASYLAGKCSHFAVIKYLDMYLGLKLGPKWPKFEVFGFFLEFKSSDFRNVAEYERQP